jgi:hypothetical protein
MLGKRILVIGIDPDKVKAPGATELDLERSRMAAEGLLPTTLAVDPAPGAAEEAVRYALGACHYEVVMIDAGVRNDPEQVSLFEQLSTLVHELAPASWIASNTSLGMRREAAAA